jgi:hypothetical protein
VIKEAYLPMYNNAWYLAWYNAYLQSAQSYYYSSIIYNSNAQIERRRMLQMIEQLQRQLARLSDKIELIEQQPRNNYIHNDMKFERLEICMDSIDIDALSGTMQIGLFNYGMVPAQPGAGPSPNVQTIAPAPAAASAGSAPVSTAGSAAPEAGVGDGAAPTGAGAGSAVGSAATGSGVGAGIGTGTQFPFSPPEVPVPPTISTEEIPPGATFIPPGMTLPPGSVEIAPNIAILPPGENPIPAGTVEPVPGE